MTIGRVVVYGVGAIGGQVAAGVRAAGHDVLAVEPWDVHAEAVRRWGLTVRDPEGRERTGDLPVFCPEKAGEVVPESGVDVLFLCVKSYDTARAIRTTLRCLGPPSVVVCLQNGMNEETVAPLLDDQTSILGGVVLVSGVLAAPGRIEVERSVSRASDPSLPGVLLGLYRRGRTPGREPLPGGGPVPQGSARRRRTPGPDPRCLTRVTELLGSVWPAATTGDLPRARWSKLATNCMLNAVSGLAGLTSAEALAHRDSRRLMIAIGAEVVEVAETAGHRLETVMGCRPRELRDGAAGRSGAADRRLAARASRVGSGAVPSLLQDLRRGRPTEIEFLNGYVARKGRDQGIATPVNRAMVRLVHRVESGGIAAGPQALAAAEGELQVPGHALR